MTEELKLITEHEASEVLLQVDESGEVIHIDVEKIAALFEDYTKRGREIERLKEALHGTRAQSDEIFQEFCDLQMRHDELFDIAEYRNKIIEKLMDSLCEISQYDTTQKGIVKIAQAALRKELTNE